MNRWSSAIAGVLDVSSYQLNQYFMGYWHDPLFGIVIYYFAIKLQMFSRRKAVKWSTAVPQCILQLNK